MTLLSSLSVVASSPSEHRVRGIGMMRQKLLGRIDDQIALAKAEAAGHPSASTGAHPTQPHDQRHQPAACPHRWQDVRDVRYALGPHVRSFSLRAYAHKGANKAWTRGGAASENENSCIYVCRGRLR